MSTHRKSGSNTTTKVPSFFSRLSALDSVYLSTETLESPMHIACLVFLEAKPLLSPTGRLRTAAIRRHIEHQWATVEAVHVQLKPTANDTEPYAWGHSDDVRSCVEVTALPAQSDDRAVLDWCAAALTPVLPRDRPLWRVHLLSGLSQGRIGLLFQMHHALCDGQGAAALLSSLMDSLKEPPSDKSKPESGMGEGPETSADSATAAVHQLVNFARNGVHAAKQAVDLAEGVAFLTTNTRTRPPTSLNQTITPERRLDTATIAFDAVQKIAHKLEATLNDVILAMVTGALRSMLQDREEDVSELTLEALVPVSMRLPDGNQAPGNRTAVLQVPLPVWEPSALERVRHIHLATNERKKHHVALAVSALESVASFVPFALLHPVSKLSMRHQNLVNIVITNLRGPTEPLVFMGAQVLGVVPFLPLAPNLPLSVAVGSYGSTLEIGVQSDPQTCPEALMFTQNLIDEFSEIERRSCSS